MSSPSEWIVSSLGEIEDDDNRSTPEASTSAETVKSVEEEQACMIPTQLFLHFDVNETILLGDDAGGDSRNESVQKMLAKSAFCRIPVSSGGSPPPWDTTQKMRPTHWWDGQEIGRETSMPPLYTGWTWPERCCPYYRTAYKKHAKSFTEAGNHGQIYGPLLEACESSLSSSRSYSIPSRSSRDDDGSSSSSNGNEHSNNNNNTILPAFYETLHHLIESCDNDGRKRSEAPPFTVIFRTFGSDLSAIAQVVTTFAKGDHPDYPGIDFPPLRLSADQLYQGRWKVLPEDDGARVIYQLWTSDESELVASGDSEILEFLSRRTVLGIRDDYNFWKASRYSPTCGKPIWVPSYRGETAQRNRRTVHDRRDDEGAADVDGSAPYSHHLLFDDNIHNLPDDGIACVRKESPSPGAAVGNGRASGETSNGNATVFETVDGTAMDEYQGVHLVRVPTIEPVLNPRWYVDQIKEARIRLQHRLRSQS